MTYQMYLIINPNAGGGNGKRMGDELMKLLDAQQISYTVHYTKQAGDEAALAKELADTVLKPYDTTAEKFPLLVVLGGDGTLSHVVNALSENPDVPIAYIPAGSGNDFSRATGIFTREVHAALSQILNVPKPSQLNVLEVTDKDSCQTQMLVNSLGIGIDGAVIHHTETSSLKKRLNRLGLGGLAYPLSVASVLFRQRPFTATIQTDETVQTFEDVYLATITNHAFFGGGISILPGANIFEGGIDVIVIEKKSWWRVGQIIKGLTAGTHLHHPDVHHLSGNTIRIEVTQPQAAQADGELLGHKPFHLEVRQSSRYFWI